ncbi:hypothetical protein, partial [Staphylococcus aureus]|uniref:hypothetical protein n=1 Tax=Staphylococcus aureus TaxID=1280 RepID=UPI001C92DE38
NYLIPTTPPKTPPQIHQQPQTQLLTQYHSFKPLRTPLQQIPHAKIPPLISTHYYPKQYFPPLKICQPTPTSNTSTHIQIKPTYVPLFFYFIQS